MSSSGSAYNGGNVRNRIVGLDRKIPLLDGSQVTYVNLDNAASTPPFKAVVETLEEFLPFYSSVHRGSGFKSRLSTAAYDEAHQLVARFLGADPDQNTVIFGKNATEAINKVSYRLGLTRDSVVLTTQLEHHSNDLPWRERATVVHIKALPDGRLDEEDFDRQLQKFGKKVKLVAVTGASNVTGFLQPIHRLARKTHEIGARILVDAAQLAPHRPINMKPDDHPEHLDFVVIAAHKMYAPFGTGALIGPKEVFREGAPEYCGGGTVNVVTLEDVTWADLPDRDEAGSPNVVGAVAMAASIRELERIGMERVAAHEEHLIRYALEKMRRIPGLTIYGEPDPSRAHEKVGVIPFNLDGVSHYLVAAVLGYEGGIAVRSGCFCAHPYVVHLLDLSEEEQQKWRKQLEAGDKSEMPGMVRMSFGCYSNEEDVDRLVDMLDGIRREEYSGKYELEPHSGEYIPTNYEDEFEPYFSLRPRVPESA